MEVFEETVDGIVVVAPRGKLDSATSPQLGARLNELATTPAVRLVLDLAEVDFVSSAGLRVMLATAKQARAAQGRLMLCGVQPPVQEVLDISGFTALLSIQSRRAEALEALAS